MNATQSLQSAVYKLRRAVGTDAPARTEASASLFRAIRWRLTIWYSGGLALVLLFAGLVLYFSVRQSLLDPIQKGLEGYAQVATAAWQMQAASPPALSFHPPCDLEHYNPLLHDALIACYDRHGNLLGQSRGMTQLAVSANSDFIDASLVNPALQNGHAQDIVDSGTLYGKVERYAAPVLAADGRHMMGVVQVALPVQSQLDTLQTLLRRLLELGLLTVALSVIAGFFLANRALLPARLAHARQRNFIADASHELRTPLTIVRADAEVLLRARERLKPDDVAILEDVVSETSHMTNLANNMLSLARLDAGGMRIEQDVVDLAAVARDTARRMGALAAEQDILVRFHEGDPVLVVGDGVLLEQVIVALVDNAIKYNRPGGEVSLHAWNEGQRAHLEVRDTGIGIDAEHLPRLGERFYRVDKARSREAGGAGLGISIVRRIVARHGGSVHFASEPGKGTAVTLSLPAARQVSAHAMP